MAISLGTPTNSGNLTNASSRTQSHITANNTKALVVVVTGYDSSSTDSAINDTTGVTFNSVSVPKCRYYCSGSAFISIHCLPNPYIGTANIVVTMGGTCTDLQVTAIGLISATAYSIVYDKYSEGDSATSSHTQTISSFITGSVVVGGIVDQEAAVTALAVTTGSEISDSEADMGSQIVGCATSTTATITWSKGTAASSALTCAFYEQFVPTITTYNCTDITRISATGEGEVNSKGTAASISRRGICYVTGTAGDPTVADSVIYEDDTFDVGPYTCAITGLTQGTGYRVRAYAITNQGLTGYGTTVQLTTEAEATPTVVLNSPDDAATGVSLTPSLAFTGTDTNNDTIEYLVQVNKVNDFTNEIGETKIGPNTDTTELMVIGCKFTASQDMTIDTISIYIITTGGGNLRLAIYTDLLAEPNALLAQTGEITAVVGLNSGLLDTPVSLTSGTIYWLMMLPSVSMGPCYRTAEGGSLWYRYYTYGTFPASLDIEGYLAAIVYTIFATNSAHLLLLKYSSTPDATFTCITDGSDTHPFDSTHQIGYTVQSDLTNGTQYFWRVKAIDPSGSNTYGVWSSIRSFTTLTAGSVIKSILGLVKASVKSWNSLAIASVKKINGLE